MVSLANFGLVKTGNSSWSSQCFPLYPALRGHLAEFGVIAPQGLRNVGKLIAIVRDEGEARLPDLARQVLQVLAAQIEQLEAAVAALVPGATVEAKWKFIHDGLSRFAGRKLPLNEEVYACASQTNFRNQSIARLLQSYGRIYLIRRRRLTCTPNNAPST